MRKFYSMLLAMLTVCTLAQAQVTFDFTGEDAYSLFGFTGFSTNESNEGDFYEATSLTSGPVTITVSPSEGHTANRMWYGSLRMYGGTLTIASSGELISSIAFEVAKWNDGNSSNVGSLETGKWTGNASSVVITIAANTQIKKIVVSLGNSGEGPGEDPVDPTPKERMGDGTLANPYNSVAASVVASELESGQITEKEYYVKGKISQIKYSFSVQYGTATFWISDDGTTDQQFQIYNTYYLGNRAWVEGDTQIALGDDVIVCGKLINYNGTPETASRQNYLYSLNGKTAGGDTPEPQPQPGMGEWESTVYSPLLVEHALVLAAGLDASTKSPQNVFVKGIVSEITEVNTQYGNATYYISDDGTTDQQLLVYRGRGVNGARFESEDALAVGDHVIVCGQIVNFKGETLEFTTGSSILSLKPAAVSVVKADAAEGDIYTIAGQRVPAITRHGLYIVGGKKVVK